jgi:hypothetical protein
MTNIARKFLEFILTTFITKAEILGERIVAILNIDSMLDVSFIIKRMRPTGSAFEAMFAFPLLWNMFDLRRQAERMVRSITCPTEHEQILICSLTTDFARFAVQAFPVGLEHFLYFIGCELQTICMKTLSTKSTCHKIALVAKGPTKVAHFFKNEPWVIEAASDGV